MHHLAITVLIIWTTSFAAPHSSLSIQGGGPAPVTLDDKPGITSSRKLYPGISREQDRLARLWIDRVWNFQWEEVAACERKLQKIEKRDQLPPLSYLLMVSQRTWRIQNDDLPDDRAIGVMAREVQQLAQKGMALSDPSRSPDTLAPTLTLIHSGIRGIMAGLKMRENPVEAAIQGHPSIKALEQLAIGYPWISDAYLFLGLFHCALSRAPSIVRGAIKVSGITVSFTRGLQYLDRCARGEGYTSVGAKLYLIQFLSPYMGDQTEWKERIFRSLRQQFPRNPYFLFLELDEKICFHPDLLPSLASCDILPGVIRNLSVSGPGLKKYAELVRRQYHLINPGENIGYDPGAELGEFTYYPLFLEGARKKNALRALNTSSETSQAEIREITQRAQRMLRSSRMGPARRGFYSWHLRDGLRT